MYGFDYDWWSQWSERQQGPGSALGPDLLGTGFALKNLELLLKGWLPAGLFARGEDRALGRPADPRAGPRLPGAAGLPDGRHPRRLPRARAGAGRVRGLLHGCGFYFGRMLRLSLLALAAAGIVFALNAPFARFVDGLAREAVSGRTALVLDAGPARAAAASRCCSCTWSSPTPAC